MEVKPTRIGQRKFCFMQGRMTLHPFTDTLQLHPSLQTVPPLNCAPHVMTSEREIVCFKLMGGWGGQTPGLGGGGACCPLPLLCSLVGCDMLAWSLRWNGGCASQADTVSGRKCGPMHHVGWHDRPPMATVATPWGWFYFLLAICETLECSWVSWHNAICTQGFSKWICKNVFSVHLFEGEGSFSYSSLVNLWWCVVEIHRASENSQKREAAK